MKHSLRLLLVIVILATLHQSAFAIYQQNVPRRLTQPDGSVFHCLATGDEYFNYLHDENGFTIIKGDDGFYYYALRSENNIVASPHRADSSDPQELGLEKRVMINDQEYKKRVKDFMQHTDKSVRAPVTGQMNNLVVYIRFSDDVEFDTPRSAFDYNFNDPEGPSLNHYFQEVSYQQLDIESHHFPVSEMTTNLSYQDTNPRGYYEPYNYTTNPIGYDTDIPVGDATSTNGRTYRQHTLLASAIAFVEDQVPNSIILDADYDGNVDNVSFIIRGEQGEWNNLLWAHRWSLWSQWVTLNGHRVYDFTFQPETQSEVYVICHEMFHALGAPDLYHYNHDGFTPAGPWDLMHSGFVHMGAYMKYEYTNSQWVQQLPEISEPGTYTLEPLYSQQNNAFRIPGPANSHEFFVVEYRKRQGHYETNIPGEGLLIYRINPYENGNSQGPPDEVYIFRPDGSPTNDGNIFQAFFSLESGRFEFNNSTNPAGFMQDGSPAGLFITNISEAGETISFEIVTSVEGVLPPENLQATVTQDYSILLEWDLPENVNQDEDSPQLSGYKVYRNAELFATIDNPDTTSFLDVEPPAGQYVYYLKAVYVQPEVMSASTSQVSAQMPGFFNITEGTEYEMPWEAGTLNMEMVSNVAQWELFTSASWIQVNPLNGSFGQDLTVAYSANNSPAERAVQIALTSDEMDEDVIIKISQHGHPSLVQDLNNSVFELFPNPVITGRLNVRFQQRVIKGHLSLFAANGMEIINADINAMPDETIVVDTDDLVPGFYVLVIDAGKQQYRNKVVIP